MSGPRHPSFVGDRLSPGFGSPPRIRISLRDQVRIRNETPNPSVRALRDRASDGALHDVPAVQHLRIGEAQHGVPARNEFAVVRDIARPIGRGRVESEAVELHHQALSDQRVDRVSGDDLLEPNRDARTPHPHREDRLQPGVVQPRHLFAEFPSGCGPPPHASQVSRCEALGATGRFPENGSGLGVGAHRDVIERVVHGLDQRGSARGRDGLSPMNHVIRAGPFGVGKHVQVEPMVGGGRHPPSASARRRDTCDLGRRGGCGAEIARG